MKSLNAKFIIMVGVVALAGIVSACGKKSDSPAAAATTGYVTCPATGYYTNGVTNQPCVPGQQVFIGSTTVCPATGYVQVNGQYQSCIPGQSVNTAGGGYGNGYGGSPQCAQYTQMYGIPYYYEIRGGQAYCVSRQY